MVPKTERKLVYDEKQNQVIYEKTPVLDENGEPLFTTKFKKELMLKSETTSMMAVQWIMKHEGDMRKSGYNITIQHAYHRGEYNYGGFKPDGYYMLDGVEYFMEFNGCHVHPDCPHCKTPDKKLLIQSPMRARWFWNQKVKAFNGDNKKLYVMWSCQWEIERTFLEEDNTPKTSLGRILLEDDTSSLLDAIVADHVFGFVVCDVVTPAHIIEKYVEDGFFFPPIFRHEVITEEMLSPYMKERVTEEGRKLGGKTVLQCFNGKQVLLLTRQVRNYVKRGLQIKNITQFFQYVPGKCFLPFTEKVVNMRIEATEEGDNGKQLTAKVLYFLIIFSNNFVKLFGNSGYGKTCENVEKYQETRLVHTEEKLAKLKKKPFYKSHVALYNEAGELGAYEVTSKQKRTQDAKPHHVGVKILGDSKIRFDE